MPGGNSWVVLGSCALLLVFLISQRSYGPTDGSVRVDGDTATGRVLRTALSELRALRHNVRSLEDRVRELQKQAAMSTPVASATGSHVPALPGPFSGVGSLHGSSTAPTFVMDALPEKESGPPRNFSVLESVTSTQPDCGMLVFRHIEKTGGTTFRMHTITLYQCGWHVWGYKGTIRLCNKGKAEFDLLVNPAARPSRADGPLLPKLTVESHAESGDFQRLLDRWVPMVQAWHGTCPLWLISIVRDPLKRQVSHFSYHKTTRGFDIKHIHNFTQYFREQSTLLNARSANPQFLQRHILLPRLLDKERHDVGTPELHAYVRLELDKFDVVGVFENYTTSMLLIARVTGLPLSKYSVPTTVKNKEIRVHRNKVRQVWAEELATEEQRAFFMKELELDYWLYNEVRERFDKLVAAGGKEFDAQLRELMRTDAQQLDASMERVCENTCDAGLNKEQATNRFVWKNQQCWPLAERELASCGKNPHLKPDFNPALCG